MDTDEKLTHIYELASGADWQGFASTPQKFAEFCNIILQVVDIDNLTTRPYEYPDDENAQDYWEYTRQRYPWRLGVVN